MRVNPEEAKLRRYLVGPLTPQEEAVHAIGMQNWHRQFQPSFSPDPMVVQEFAKGFGLRPFPQNVRGPQASFAPGGRDFIKYFGNQSLPKRAFYSEPYNNGNPVPIPFQNRWGSNYAARQKEMVPFVNALAMRLTSNN
jgi:hypothetical protein